MTDNDISKNFGVCSACGSPVLGAMFLAAPGRLCTNDECGVMWGPSAFLWWLFARFIVDDDGDVPVIAYVPGAFWRALRAFLAGDV